MNTDKRCVFFRLLNLSDLVQIMASIRTNKNIKSSISSAVFVGLRAEYCHFSELHATKMYTDSGINVIDTLIDLQQKVEELNKRLDSLALKDLADVNISSVSQGDTLLFKNDTWQPAELFKEDNNEQEDDA